MHNVATHPTRRYQMAFRPSDFTDVAPSTTLADIQARFFARPAPRFQDTDEATARWVAWEGITIAKQAMAEQGDDAILALAWVQFAWDGYGYAEGAVEPIREAAIATLESTSAATAILWDRCIESGECASVADTKVWGERFAARILAGIREGQREGLAS
jgi:hypothetical protein